MCVFDKKDFSSRFIHVDAEKIVSWKDGKLVFINEPFDKVVKKLNRRYGVNIIIEDKKLEDYTYLATFLQDETLDEVLKLLALSAPIKVTDLGREIEPDGSYGERTIKFHYKTK
jgi:ferric-dicitrate binding protein FerR (iron transport regulator)